MSPATAPLVTLVAVGNAFATDDRVALLVATTLATRWRNDPRVRFVELDGEPTRILDAWRGSREGWVVDAMSSGAPAGCIEELDPDAVAVSTVGAGRRGTHAAGVGEAIALGRALGALPPRVRVFGIEGAHFGPGDQLSPALTGLAFAAVVESLDQTLREALRPVGLNSSGVAACGRPR